MGTVTHCDTHYYMWYTFIHHACTHAPPRTTTRKHHPERGTATAFVHQVYCGNVANTVRIRCITAGVANTTASSPPPPPPAVALTNTD